MAGIWVPWRLGSPSQQAAQRRAKGRAVKGQVTSKAAIAQARKAHRKKALKELRAGKLTPKQYQRRLRQIG
jgi:hypothetical protein